MSTEISTRSKGRRNFLKAAAIAMGAAVGAPSVLAAGAAPSVDLMQQCIDACLRCYKTCLKTIPYCLQMGGSHAAPDHIELMVDCTEICQTAASFMLRGSSSIATICALCADICNNCAANCAQFSNDAKMQECARQCRNCARLCQQMAMM